MGTPLCIPSKEFIDIGKIASIEINQKQVDTATKGQKVAIKVGITLCYSVLAMLAGFISRFCLPYVVVS